MHHIGLVLAGGGARGAYQIGALRGIAEIFGPGASPFTVVTGISAGAINAAAIAAGSEDFMQAAERIAEAWARLTPDRVYRTQMLRLAGIGARWIRDLSFGVLGDRKHINYLLDSAPLRVLLEEQIAIEKLHRHLRSGRLRGVAVSTTSYQTGTGVTFFDGAADIEPWTRTNRVGVRAKLTLDHILASSAMPVFFTPVKIGDRFYGDGCVRMALPLSPAIRLGAERILAIGIRHRQTPQLPFDAGREGGPAGVSASEIAGFLLNAVFLDSLEADLEQLERLNRMLTLVPRDRLDAADRTLRQIPVLVLRPSENLGELAADEYARFPAMLRYLLRGIGAHGPAGRDLLSYLAFEPVYLRRIMQLGFDDALKRRLEIQRFLASPIERKVEVVSGGRS